MTTFVPWLVSGSLLGPLPTPGTGPLAYDGFDRRREEGVTWEATPSRADGVYGRFDGPLTFSPCLSLSRLDAGFVPGIGVRVHYLSTLGLSASYGTGTLWPGHADSVRSMSRVGLELRPLFLLRWSNDWEKGPSVLDLTLDSLSLGVGGFLAKLDTSSQLKRGLDAELAAGVPLIGHALGPWIGIAATLRVPPLVDDGSHVALGWLVRLEYSLVLSSSASE